MVETLISTGMTFLEKTNFYKQLGLDTKTILRHVFIECRKNLSILENLDFENKNLNPDSRGFVIAASKIQMESFELLLADEGTSIKAFKELSSASLGLVDDDHLVESESISDKVIRLYVRMYSLRSLALIRQENNYDKLEGQIDTDFRRRLKNLKIGLLQIEKALLKKIEYIPKKTSKAWLLARECPLKSKTCREWSGPL